MKLETLVIFALTLKSLKVNINLLFAFQCPDGGIGRRARLKLVFLGVWVRFPLRVLKKPVIVLLINTLQAFFIVVARPFPDNYVNNFILSGY